jgi:hypothetical protein
MRFMQHAEQVVHAFGIRSRQRFAVQEAACCGRQSDDLARSGRKTGYRGFEG